MTISMGFSEPDEMEFTLSSLIMESLNEEVVRFEETIISHKEGVDIIPSNIELS